MHADGCQTHMDKSAHLHTQAGRQRRQAETNMAFLSFAFWTHKIYHLRSFPCNILGDDVLFCVLSPCPSQVICKHYSSFATTVSPSDSFRCIYCVLLCRWPSLLASTCPRTHVPSLPRATSNAGGTAIKIGSTLSKHQPRCTVYKYGGTLCIA